MSLYQTAISWLLYCIRDTIGLEEIRNIILAQFITNKKLLNKLIFGKTFSCRYKTSNLIKYLTLISSFKNIIILFTVSNLPDKSNESHYMTFILNNNKKQLIMIDPALNKSKPGIYKPYIAVQTIKPIFINNNYDVKWLQTNNTCQTYEDDVFCQSWSLYLQLMYINSNEIDIPIDQYRKYEILLNFYKIIALQIPEFCSDLNNIYNKQINKNKIVVNSKTGVEAKRIRDDILAFGTACQLLTGMQAKDMFA